MRVVSKVATGSALLFALLAAVLSYQLWLFQDSVTSHDKLSDKQLTTSSQVLTATRTLDQFGFFSDRAAVISEPGLYLMRRESSALDFEMKLDEMEKDLQASWEVPVGGNLSPPDYRLEQALMEEIRRNWSRLYYESPNRWVDALFVLPDSGQGAPNLPFEVGAISNQLLALSTVVEQSIRDQLGGAMKSTGEATRLSKWSIGAALALAALIVLLTILSLNGPLKRLAKGTREIAAGHFEYRFDESRRDEFARLAGAFNRMAEKLGQLDQMKKDFVAHVSHEIKSPLVTMQETNQLLADEIPGPLNPKQRRLIELNLHGGRRLSAMISNLLDLSSLEAGGMTFDFKSEDVVGLLRLVVTSLEHRASEKEVTLRIEPAGGRLSIIGACDRDRTIQVIENLVDNAVKFSPRGGTVITSVQSISKLPESLPARLRSRLAITSRDRSFVYLTVDDEGPGVPDGEKEAIFEKFHQASNTARIGTGGVGLGLAICGEIVEAHGGAVWVTDRPSGGSCFHLMLPGPAPAVRRLPKAAL